MCVRSYIEGLIRINSRLVRRSYISYCVATCLANGNAIPLKQSPQFRRSVKTYKMYLHVLSCCKVEITDSKFIGHICNALPLGQCHFTIRQFYAYHLHTGLALSIDATG